MKKVGDNIKSSVGAFNFSGSVHKKFENHVSKSVPFYNMGHNLICKLSSFFLVNKSVAYDLGSSTGNLSRSLSKYNKDLKIKIIGLDEEKKMVNHAKKQLNKNDKKRIFYKKCDIKKFNFKKSDLIISYYTIQFIKPKYRQKIYDRIF